MLKFLFFLLFLSFTQALYAQGHSYFQACFTNKSIARSASKEITFIKNKSDRIKLVGKCLDFYVEKVREELYTKFLQVKFGGLYQLSSSKVEEQKQCKLELIKLQRSKGNDTDYQVGSRLKLSKTNHKSLQTSSMNIYISDGMDGGMDIDGERYRIKCRVTNMGYSLEISSSSPNISLSTSRFVAIGQSIELGNFVQQVNDQKNKISINSGIKSVSKLGNEYSSIKLRAR